MSDPTLRYSKLRLALRHWMLGRSAADPAWLVALEAQAFAETLHRGIRKDGATPEFSHQVEAALHLRTLSGSLRHPARTIACCLLHDTCEDADVGFEEIASRFGSEIAEATRLLTKIHRGTRKHPDAYFADIAECPVASLVKLADRCHNLSSMEGAFSPQKQAEYCAETRERFLPMLKAAKRRFPDQEGAYENLKSQLTLLLRLGDACSART